MRRTTDRGGEGPPTRPTVLLCTDHGWPLPLDPLARWCAGLVGGLPQLDVVVWAAPTEAGAGPDLADLVGRLVQVVAAPPVDVPSFVTLLAELHENCTARGIDRDAVVAGLAANEADDPAGDPDRAGPTDVVNRLLAALAGPLPRADLVHATGSGLAAVPGILLAHTRGTPFLVGDHDVALRRELRRLDGAGAPASARRLAAGLLLAVARSAYALADQVVAASHDLVRWQQELGADPGAVEVAYDAADETRFTPLAVARSADAPLVVQTGTVGPEHDPLTFLEVAARVHARRPEVRFHHYGAVGNDDYARRVFARRDELGLDEVVLFLGATPEPWVAYNQADVVCLTAGEGGFPFAVVEAMLCGRPVVTTDVGGAREVLGRAGVLAAPGDADALADGVRFVLDIAPAVQEAMGAEGRERARSHFTLTRSVAAYRRTYDRLLRGGAARRPVAAAPAADASTATATAREEGYAAAPTPVPALDVARALARRAGGHPDPEVRLDAVTGLERLVADEQAGAGASNGR
jgi:glycosyltransferase involved in cell wall biosynthesis